MIALALLAGCTADLLPGEQVIGADLAAIQFDGERGGELGSSVDLAPDGLLATEPGSDRVRAWSLDGDELFSWQVAEGGGLAAWWWEGSARAFVRGSGVWERTPEGGVSQVSDEPLATGVAPCTDGSVAYVYGAGEAVACGEEGVLSTACDGSVCSVLWDGEAIGEASPSSAVAWVDGAACWGDVRTDTPGWAGSVTCEPDLDLDLDGMDGDHLGVALAGGRAAGVFNKWQVPARARIVSQSGGDAWAVDRAAEQSRIALAHNAGWWAVGVPGWFAHEARQGRVYLFQAASP